MKKNIVYWIWGFLALAAVGVSGYGFAYSIASLHLDHWYVMLGLILTGICFCLSLILCISIFAVISNRIEVKA